MSTRASVRDVLYAIGDRQSATGGMRLAIGEFAGGTGRQAVFQTGNTDAANSTGGILSVRAERKSTRRRQEPRGWCGVVYTSQSGTAAAGSAGCAHARMSTTGSRTMSSSSAMLGGIWNSGIS